MNRTDSRADADDAARSMSTTLLLLVIGGVVVVLDINADGTPLVPDVVGYLVLAVAGARLSAQSAEIPDLRAWLRRVGGGLVVVAGVSAVDWLATLGGQRPPSQGAGSGLAWFDAALLAASVAVGVLVLATVARWFAERGHENAANRLRRAAHVAGWPWGAFALLSVGGAAVSTVTDFSESVETPLVAPLVLGMFAALAYCAWALLRTRREIRTDAPPRQGP